MTDNIIEAYISSTKNIKNKYTSYEIIVCTNIKTLRNYYTLHKRYSDFHKFHKLISKRISELPAFPCKVFDKMAHDVVNDRMTKFNFYIKYLCMLVTKNEVNEETRALILKFLTN